MCRAYSNVYFLFRNSLMSELQYIFTLLWISQSVIFVGLIKFSRVFYIQGCKNVVVLLTHIKYQIFHYNA
jgi:hypothetical protein